MKRRWHFDIFGLALFVAHAVVAGRAQAQTRATIRYDSDEQLQVARRLASELASEGYAVEITTSTQPSPCEAGERPRLRAAPAASVWIQLRVADASNDTVVASICYLGALPFLQQVAASAPRNDPVKLALSTAEALNGLRARVPPLENTESTATRAAPSAGASARRAPAPPTPTQPPGSASLGPALLLNLPDFPAAFGAEARANLAVARSIDLTLDVFVPTLGSELPSESVTATLRTTWLRVGPRFVWTHGDVGLSTALVVGPALTWATGVARRPRAGSADIAPGAVLALVQGTEYPARAPWFGFATFSASALLPGARVKLWNDAPSPRGSFPLVATLGLGARFGR